jgi:hypothetical protein
MAETDFVYWNRRYWEECSNANRAQSPEVRLVHSRLAKMYIDRLGAIEHARRLDHGRDELSPSGQVSDSRHVSRRHR